MKHIRKISENFKDRQRKKLEEEILKKKKEMEDLDGEESPIVDLSDYSIEEKVKFFDKIYKMALDHLNETEEERYKNDDTDHWFFEEGFAILNLKDKKKLFNFYNKLLR